MVDGYIDDGWLGDEWVGGWVREQVDGKVDDWCGNFDANYSFSSAKVSSTVGRCCPFHLEQPSCPAFTCPKPILPYAVDPRGCLLKNGLKESLPN